MQLETDWSTIRDVFEAGIHSSKHCAIASVDANGHPHITPIGFVFLNDDRSAFYFEQYSRRLPENFAHNRRVCLMTVNSSTAFWLQALARGRFGSHPGMRLYGEAGERRAATAAERERLARRIGGIRRLRGAKLIWSGLATVRDVKLTGVEAVRYPSMMEGLK